MPVESSVAPAPPPAPPPALPPALPPAPPPAPAENAMPPPAPVPANQRAESAPPRQRSPRLNPIQGNAHAIKSPPVPQPHHSSKRSKMARTYLLTVSHKCLGRKANPLSFTSLQLVDLRNGHSQYLSTIAQLVDALPKSMDPASSFALQGHIARPGQTRLRYSMRAAIWFLLPSDGVFRRSSLSLQYFLTRKGRRVILPGGGGDLTPPPWEWERHLNCIHETSPLPQEITARRISLPQKNPASSPER